MSEEAGRYGLTEEQYERIKAEVARVQAGYVHPDVEPGYYIGSVVKHDGRLFQVVARAIEPDGRCQYLLGHEMEERVVAAPLDRLTGQPVEVRASMRLAEDADPDLMALGWVDEGELEPANELQRSAGKAAPAAGPGDAASASEGAHIARE